MQLRDYFRTEAEDYLAALELAASGSPLELGAVRRSARGLSGVARLAGEPRILRAAAALDRISRATEPAHAVSLGSVLREALPHFRTLVAADAPLADLDAHADAVIERCTAEQPAPVIDEPVAVDEAEFRRFVSSEAAGIADALDEGIAAFVDDPQGRDALGVIIRRQRSLLGSARLAEMGIVAETLRAVEDVAELIVRLDVPIKSEWLDVFRTAKDVLRVAVSNLEDGDLPGSTHSLSRLRTLREELVDRYGDKEAAPEGSPASDELAADAATNERAGRLRMELMNAIGANARARTALEELYALALRASR
jgi:hypothetical protein